jgi:hypothetical protein
VFVLYLKRFLNEAILANKYNDEKSNKDRTNNKKTIINKNAE